MQTSVFFQKYVFPTSSGEQIPVFPPTDAHAIIDYFNKASSSNEKKETFLTNC